MCGIAGFLDEGISRDSAPSLMQKMLRCMAHRGPDFTDGWYDQMVALGHNRLSIIDLKAEANQPMHYMDLVLVFNGEIYNYKELKAELIAKQHRFQTQSDSEVLLAAYKEWGPSCVNRMVGMWSFAIWDKRKRELFCSRDRFGIKPFYYIFESGKFYFASEAGSLKRSPMYQSTINLEQVSRGLQLGWIGYEDETYFQKIKALPAAHNLTLSDKGLTIERYWDIDFQVENQGTFENRKDTFSELFEDSIRLHMRSDVEVGGALSGGLDSASIASVVASKFPETRFKTFTIYYSGSGSVDERPFAEKVSSKYKNIQPFTYQPSDAEIAEDFDRVAKAQEFPFAGSSPISQYYVMKLAAKEGVKVLLDGQGSDEFLAGYMHSFYRWIGGHLRNMNFPAGISALRSHASLQEFNSRKSMDVLLKSGMAAMFSEQKLYALEYRNYLPFLSNRTEKEIPFNLAPKGNSRLNQFLYQLLTVTSLPTLLHFEDRNSMAFSIESRVPFLDHRLVEFAFAIPDTDKIQDGLTKKILREAMRKYLPDEIYQRKDKKGFVTPGEVKWLRGPLKFLVEQDFSTLDFLNKGKVQNVVDNYKKGDNRNATLVWRLALLKYWTDKVI